MGYAMADLQSLDLIPFAAGTFAAALVTGVAGFAFGIVAAAVWLHFLTPAHATALIVAYGLIVQGSLSGSCAGRYSWHGCCRFCSAP